MKNFYNMQSAVLKQWQLSLLLFLLLAIGQTGFAQPATVSNPLAMGANCSGSTPNFKAFSYDSVAKKLTQIGANCNPSLQAPGFNPGGGSIAFSPKDQKVYYIETTTGNNSIVWSWTPGTCPTGSQAPIYTYASTFIVGLEFDTRTGDGYQLEFSTGAAPYNIYLRKIISFGPPLVAGATQQIILPVGKTIYQQNGDIVITPTGKMYMVLDNKMFSLDYSTYGTGVLNANYIDTMKNGVGNNVIGLAYAGGNFIESIQGSTCAFKQIDISSTLGATNVQPVTLASGTFIAYDMATMVTGIGVAKKVYSLQKTGVSTYRVAYDIKVKNYGNVNLNSVQVFDSVKTAFGASFLNASIAAVGTLPTGLTLNPLFNGNTIAGIFAAGGTMKASPADSATVRVTVNLLNPVIASTYFNSAIGTATGAIFANLIRDSSDNQATLNPDISGTDVPDLKGEGVPTPITPLMWLLLGNNIKDFNAKANGKVNKLYWTLDNQEAGTKVVVQRSADGVSFENLITLNSNNASLQDYSWDDASPLATNNFYRLQISSPGNSNVISNVVLVKTQDDNTIITASPNPFTQSLKFSLNLDKAGRINYRVLDFVSAVLDKGEYEGHVGRNEIDVNNISKLPSGTYILEVMVGDKHYFKKVVKY